MKSLYLLLPLMFLPSCIGTPVALPAIEDMTDSQFADLKLTVQLLAKIGAHRLLVEGVTTPAELQQYASVIEEVRDAEVQLEAQALLKDAADLAGLTNDEVTLILVLIENKLLKHSGLVAWLNSETGLYEWSPRSQELLTTVADALKTATNVTPEEASKATEMNIG
jgi:hypothetical protein